MDRLQANIGLAAGLALAATGAPADPAWHALGKKVFLEMADPRCGICHKLADAGTSGEIGPKLDALKPDAALVRAAVSNGIGVMPVFEGLTPKQVEAVALYVASSTAGVK